MPPEPSLPGVRVGRAILRYHYVAGWQPLDTGSPELADAVAVYRADP